MTASDDSRRSRRSDRMSLAEITAMMRRPSYWRPVPPPPALHQMARLRLDDHQDDDTTNRNGED